MIKTNPAPPLLPEHEIEARIRAIKERMLREGVTKPAAVIEEEVRKRHETLRQRPPGDTPPPLHDSGNRPSTPGRGSSKRPPINN